MTTRTYNSKRQSLIAALFALILATVVSTILLPALALGQVGRVARLENNVKIDAAGDGHVQLNLELPAQTYMQAKQEITSPLFLVRMLSSAKNYSEIENLTAQFDDAAFGIRASYVQRGMTRVAENGKWYYAVGQDRDITLISSHGNTAVLNVATESDLGVINIICRFTAPEGSTNVRYDAGRGRITYDYQPEIAEGATYRADMQVDARPHLMSSLAKLHSDEQFPAFWLARGIFKNTGGMPVTDYRVRFRVDGYSSWSEWHRSSVVYPGQSVIDPYFPVLDSEKLAELNGPRTAMIQIEYEYRLPNGQLIQETDAVRTRILGRNEVVFSSRANDQVLSWYEQYDLLPFVMAAFTDASDPVIQQLAGRISGMAGGAAAAANDDDAATFLIATWVFMQSNRITYQTPPGVQVNGHFGQHIKYGRDVLVNRAGTCIDLAVLWASITKSVGLRSYIMVVPGHAFPVVQLPGGAMIPIESTLIAGGSFEDALRVGRETYQKALQGPNYLVDIDTLHNAGVRSLELPRADNDFLTRLGYQFELPNQQQEQQQQAGGNSRQSNYRETSHRQPNAPEQTNEPEQRSVVGTLDRNSIELGDGSLANVHNFQMEVGYEYAFLLESDEFDAFLWVQPTGDLDHNSAFGVDDDSAGGTNALVQLVCHRTVDCQIVVNSYEPGQSGRYRLTVVRQRASGN